MENKYKIVVVLKQIWLDFKTSLSKKIILKKSLWYILGMAAYVQVSIKIYFFLKFTFNKITYLRNYKDLYTIFTINNFII